MMTSIIMGLAAVVCFAPLSVVEGIIESSVGYNFEKPWTSPLTVLVFISMLRAICNSAIGFILTGAMAHAFYEMVSVRRGSANDKRPPS
jgi:hypothetical protein